MVSIYSIIGVILGWLLNEISYYFRTRGEDKKELKVSVMELLHLYNNILYIRLSIKNAAKYKKKFDKDFSEMEARRLRNISLSITDMNDIVCEVEKVKEKIARFDPIIGNSVSEIAILVQRISNNIKFKETSKVPELYIEQIINIESALEILEEKIKNTILKLSLKVNLLLYFKIRKKLKAKKQIGSFLDELDDESIKDYYNFKKDMDFKNDLDKNLYFFKKDMDFKNDLDKNLYFFKQVYDKENK